MIFFLKKERRVLKTVMMYNSVVFCVWINLGLTLKNDVFVPLNVHLMNIMENTSQLVLINNQSVNESINQSIKRRICLYAHCITIITG
jgi:hypothetical protein